MTEEHFAKLFAACVRLEKWLDVQAEANPFTSGMLSVDDGRLARVEHVCHELGHAVLLGIGLGPKLEDRVEAELKTDWASKLARVHIGRWTRAELNEVQTFAVEMAAMEALGFELDYGVFEGMCLGQVFGTREIVRAEWDAFRSTKRCQRLAQRIVAVFGRAMA